MIHIFYFCAFLLFWSCGPDALRKKLDLKIIKGESNLLVIDAFAAAREDKDLGVLEDSIRVKITRSGALGTNDFPIINNAQVEISEGNTIHALTYDANEKAYFLKINGFLEAGKEYSLKIELEGKTYRASSVLQAQNNSLEGIKIISISPNNFFGRADILTFSYFRPVDTYHRVKVLYDIPKNPYRQYLRSERINEILLSPEPLALAFVGAGNLSTFFTRRPNEETVKKNDPAKFRSWIDARLESNDKATIQLWSISFETYEFWRRLQIIEGGNGPGSNYPANPKSNWNSSDDSEVLGYFALVNLYQQTYTAP